MRMIRPTLSASRVFALTLVTLLGCGGLADPSLTGDNVAVVSGALTSGVAAPANARVAVVFRRGATAAWDVVAEAPLVDGHFEVTLDEPPAVYLAPVDVSDAPKTSETIEPGRVQGATLEPSGQVVGGQVVDDLEYAVAGFVVYADTNGNGKLDLEGDYAASPDEILGGNRELTLVHLKGGGNLDFEKLRDRSGVLPERGYNLSWSSGSSGVSGRWVGLDLVELKLSTHELPAPVCFGGASSSVDEDGLLPSTSRAEAPSTDAGAADASSTDAGAGTSVPYPAPDDPNLHCDGTGRSFTYVIPSECPPPPPPPVGLCAGGWSSASACRAPTGWSVALADGEPVPEGWPCPVTSSKDGGASDASVDGGAADGGAADGGAADGG